jgi:hypothetical protein
VPHSNVADIGEDWVSIFAKSRTLTPKTMAPPKATKGSNRVTGQTAVDKLLRLDNLSSDVELVMDGGDVRD